MKDVAPVHLLLCTVHGGKCIRHPLEIAGAIRQLGF